jgi:hypothetical protein
MAEAAPTATPLPGAVCRYGVQNSDSVYNHSGRVPAHGGGSMERNSKLSVKLRMPVYQRRERFAMKSKLKPAIIVGSIGSLALIIAAPFFLWFGPHPMCHRLVVGGFQQWMLETGQTNEVYPNASGSGSNSLAMIERFVGPEIRQYGYVAGLSETDSADLVLMYMKTKTAYTWHADHSHTMFSSRHWMVISPGIVGGGCPEGGALLDTPEFKRRLERTIAFLKVHQRPYWQFVAEEHSNFLNSLEVQ